MLAIGDQENLVHGHQTAAASKPLNGGLKQLNPRTPGIKAPKTPFPLNDENDANAIFGGKPGKNTVGKGGATAKKGMLGDKNAFVTPVGPRTRAPLGQKTTNAKAKGVQTPGAPLGNDLGKSKQKSASARTQKPKPRVSHAETVKVDVLADADLEEREIEYMPPRVKNLPDIPDDGTHNINLTMFKNGNLTRDCLQHYYDTPDANGISFNQRQAMEEKKRNDRLDSMHEATLKRDMDLLTQPCLHIPECASEECKHEAARKHSVETEYQKKMSSLRQPLAPTPRPKGLNKGPSALASRKASSALSMSKPSGSNPAVSAPKPPKFPASLLSQKKAIAPINPDPKRHATAVRASNTTMGYSKGRAASATLRKTVLPKDTKAPTKEQPDRTLAPVIYIERYGVPPIGSDMWMRCNTAGCFDEDDLEDDWSKQSADLFEEEAEQDFILTL